LKTETEASEQGFVADVKDDKDGMASAAAANKTRSRGAMDSALYAQVFSTLAPGFSRTSLMRTNL
jgi:hypothetical protein